MRHRIALALALLVVVLAPACGDDGQPAPDNSDSSSSTGAAGMCVHKPATEPKPEDEPTTGEPTPQEPDRPPSTERK